MSVDPESRLERVLRVVLILVAAAAVSLMAVSASAVSFHADLDEDQEVPPFVRGPNEIPSFGIFDLILEGDAMTWTFVLQTESIENPLTEAHIHSGAFGEPGPIVQPLFDLTDVPVEITGDLVASGDFVNPDLKAGLLACAALGAGTFCDFYVNVHTTVHMPGEIRGQVQVVPEPSALLLLVGGLMGALALRRRPA